MVEANAHNSTKEFIVRVPAVSLWSILRAAGIDRIPEPVFNKNGNIADRDNEQRSFAVKLGKLIEKSIDTRAFSNKEISGEIARNKNRETASYQLIVRLSTSRPPAVPADIAAGCFVDYCAAILCLQGGLYDAAPEIFNGGRRPLSGNPGRAVYWALLSLLTGFAIVGITAIAGLLLENRDAPAHGNKQPEVVSREGSPPEAARLSRPATPTRPVKSLEVVAGNTEKDNHRLFVFSDPLCPYCKRIETSLSAMAARGYEIHIFPTPVHDESRQLVAELACASDKLAAWRALIAGEKHVNDGRCPLAQTAADDALAFFRQFGFNQTPTIINNAGDVHVGLFRSDDELAAFIARK